MAVIDQVKSVLPSISVSTIGNFLYWLLIFFIFLIIVGGLFGLWAWWYVSKKNFKYTIKIFEKVDGRYRPTITDNALERRIGEGGDTVFYLRKLKKIVPRPNIQTGNNTFWFAKREDGELINIGMEDIDLKMREAGVYYLDNELRYSRASLQKLNKDRNLKEKFWDKYGNMILSIVFIVIIAVMLLLITSKLMQVIGNLDGVIKTSAVVMEKTEALLGAVDRVCGNTGVVKAGGI